MQELLKKKYNELKKICILDNSLETTGVAYIIKEVIDKFAGNCKNPAIWCYGKHTRMLMTDFIFELRKVNYIIDNGIKKKEDSGFKIIDKSKIREKNIDGIIISSWIYRNEIVNELKSNYQDIPFLDIYIELEKKGIYLNDAYYVAGHTHPHERYRCLNKMQRKFFQEKNSETCQLQLKKIIQIYIEIKDFQSAISYTEKLIELSDGQWEKDLLNRLLEIYELQLELMNKINEKNVVMVCIDGLRSKEISEKYMKNLYNYIKNNTYFYSNAYSISTSTYESLIPAYSENSDLRTKYYDTNLIVNNGCRFITEAKAQERKIFFYTDGCPYIKDEAILVTTQLQTATEKLWDFLLDAIDEKNGLFYIHILFESHFSYPNPYTKDKIVSEGTHIFFDYLKRNGGGIRTNYDKQQKDALKYLDDNVVPLIEQLQCRMVLFADHGNILLDKGTEMKEIEKIKYTFHEDLIRVPLVIRSPEKKIRTDESLISIMELNNIVIALMNKKEYIYKKHEFVKVLRSEIYNPDFRYLYKESNNVHGLLAFEVFIFKEGYKLAIYADGLTELYLCKTDENVRDMQIKKFFLSQIKSKITVCEQGQIK